MLLDLILDLHNKCTEEEFELILRAAKDDIDFYKKLEGSTYTEDRITDVLRTTSKVVGRL